MSKDESQQPDEDVVPPHLKAFDEALRELEEAIEELEADGPIADPTRPAGTGGGLLASFLAQ